MDKPKTPFPTFLMCEAAPAKNYEQPVFHSLIVGSRSINRLICQSICLTYVWSEHRKVPFYIAALRIYIVDDSDNTVGRTTWTQRFLSSPSPISLDAYSYLSPSLGACFEIGMLGPARSRSGRSS